MRSRWPLLVALAGIAAWLVVALITWAGAAPLGHDESQYAISAREAMHGVPPRWFYLSLGMHWIARPGIWLGSSEMALRLFPLVLGVGFLLAAWAVARRSVDALSAGLALLVIAGTRNVARYSTDLLSDMPAAAGMLAALAVFLGEIDRDDGPRWRILLAAPLLAASIYVRYGSVVPVAVIVIAALAVGARTLARRPWPVIATAGLFLVLLVPHFLEAQEMTGSPLGILLASRGVPQEQYAGEGLVTYLTSNPFKLYGFVAPVVLVAGLFALRVRDRRRLLVWLVAVGTLVAMGFTTHAQPRYILITLALLTVLGTDQLREWISRVSPRIGGAIALAALVIVWLMTARVQMRSAVHRDRTMRGTLLAASIIKRDDAGAPCVVIGYHFTQLEWYSGCQAPVLMDAGAVDVAEQTGQRVYVVRDYLPAWAAAPQPVFTTFPGRLHVLFMLAGEIEVARLDRP